ncbi:MAG: TIR domain-containing protein [Chloroflexi bacterium]|uniref:TIR domain-containing protein n=1 Tax=Candidatus Flexifilum breve TaxID=3140694 RepID=UPI0031358857|nr:TIR domain-containing protein [Chloroflexota bacterium]
MNDGDKFSVFLEQVLQRSLPLDPIARIRILAKELAEGAVNELWYPTIISYDETGTKLDIQSQDLKSYFEKRWYKTQPSFSLLLRYGYLDERANAIRLTKQAFDLLEEIEPAKVFVSYSRTVSSAFALLIAAQLKNHGINAFVDMSIQPGDDWHAHLKEQVEKREYFVLLLGGKQSVESPYVQGEIKWALQSNSVIIPIWHNRFEYKSGDFDVSPEIDNLLSMKQAIPVLSESASGYNTALVQLLNRFGITP